MNLRNDPHTCWTISAIVSYVHLKNFRCLQQEPIMSVQPLRRELVNLLGSCVPIIGVMNEGNVLCSVVK